MVAINMYGSILVKSEHTLQETGIRKRIASDRNVSSQHSLDWGLLMHTHAQGSFPALPSLRRHQLTPASAFLSDRSLSLRSSLPEVLGVCFPLFYFISIAFHGSLYSVKGFFPLTLELSSLYSVNAIASLQSPTSLLYFII